MPTPPKTYDEIVRATVPDLDSSFRPTEEQKRQAYEGFRALDVDEQELSDRVNAELTGDEVEHVQVEVTGTTVTLRGSVRDSGALARVNDLVRDVRGVGEVVDRLVIAPI